MTELTRAYGGVEVLSTGELCNELGVVVSSKKLREVGIEPMLTTGNAIYWRRSDLADACLALSVYFAELANIHVRDLNGSVQESSVQK